MFTGSVLAARQGKIIYRKAFGIADRRWNISNRVDTKYKIGSITKQFTAMLVLQLVQEGKIQLDGKVSDYQPFHCPRPVSLALVSCGSESEIQKVIEVFKRDHHKYSIKQNAVNGVGFRSWNWTLETLLPGIS